MNDEKNPSGMERTGSSGIADSPSGAVGLPVRAALARRCCYCGQPFRTQRTDKRFCRNTCQRRYQRKLAVRGAQVVPLLLSWRRDRSRGALTDITRLADRWIAEDRVRARQSNQQKKEKA